MTTSGLSVRIWNDAGIARRDSDGYVNATAMCQANGKEWKNYFQTDRAKAYIAALSESLGIPADQLVITTTTGPNEFRGTWIHPRIAVDLARVLGPAFAVWMDGWFLEAHQLASQPLQRPLDQYATRQDLQQVADMAQLACDTTLRLSAIIERTGCDMQGWQASTPWPVFPATPAKLGRRSRPRLSWPCSNEDLARATTRLLVNANRYGVHAVGVRHVQQWCLFGRRRIYLHEAREFLREAASRYRLGCIRPGQRGSTIYLHLHSCCAVTTGR